MRRFEDDRGRSWDVVVGRESWGAFVAIFVPGSGEEAVRQSPLESVSAEGAATELSGLGREELLRLLEESKPKDVG